MSEYYREVIVKSVEEMAGLLDEPARAYAKLSNLLDELSDENAMKSIEIAIPSVSNYHGVRGDVLNRISSELAKHIKGKDEVAHNLLKYLWKTNSYEERIIVSKVIGKLIKKNPQLWVDFIIDVVPDITNWAVCDTLATQGLEPQTLKDPDKTLSLSDRWVDSNDLFVRRFGVVALRAFKKAPITKKVFELLDRVMGDEEHYIKKAISWILREISKQDHMKIHEYLMCYAKDGADKATKWIIKNGMKNLPRDKQQELIDRLG